MTEKCVGEDKQIGHITGTTQTISRGEPGSAIKKDNQTKRGKVGNRQQAELWIDTSAREETKQEGETSNSVLM